MMNMWEFIILFCPLLFENYYDTNFKRKIEDNTLKLSAYNMCFVNIICYRSERFLQASFPDHRRTPTAACLSRDKGSQGRIGWDTLRIHCSPSIRSY